MSYHRRRINDRIKKLEAERKYGKPIMKDYTTGEWVPAHYTGGILFKGRAEKKSSTKGESKRKIEILDILNNDVSKPTGQEMPKCVVEFIEAYEAKNSEEIWNKEAEKIYSTGGETLYQFRGQYYKGTRPFISRKNTSGREVGGYGEETRGKISEEEANNFIEEYETKNPEEIWSKEAEKIYSTGGETLYQFRGKYYIGIKEFISKRILFGKKSGYYGEETRVEISEEEANKYIEEYEAKNPEEIWNKEAEKIYSTGGETLYQFRGKYYKGTKEFISRRSSFGKESGYYGEETRIEISEEEANKYIEEYEEKNPEEIWNKEAEKIYSTGGETLYKFRGKYYKGTKEFISRRSSSGKESGYYGEETRVEILEEQANKFIQEYERKNPEEIWNKEAKKIYSTGGETLYQFRGKYYKGTRPFISRKNTSGREVGGYGKETLYAMEDREERTITLASIKLAIERSKGRDI